jgi:hypothetical protein
MCGLLCVFLAAEVLKHLEVDDIETFLDGCSLYLFLILGLERAL